MKFHSDADFQRNQLLNPVVHQAAVPPESPVQGQLYYDTARKTLNFYDGSTWVELPALCTQVFSFTGPLSAQPGTLRFYNFTGSPRVIHNVWASVGTAPTGADLIIDVNKGGTTIFTTQNNRPTVVAGSNVSTPAVPDVTLFESGSYLTVDIDQVGSTVAGADLTVGVVFS